MRATCRICGTALDTKTAHTVVANGKSAYYCSAEEFESDEAKKKKVAADKEKVYRLICDIIGRKEIVNSALWKEKAVWNKVATDEIVGQYLEENKDYLTCVINRLDDVEYNRIRYLSAVLKNKLGDYKPKQIVNESEQPKVNVDQSFYESTHATCNRRRSLADLEDEF